MDDHFSKLEGLYLRVAIQNLLADYPEGLTLCEQAIIFAYGGQAAHINEHRKVLDMLTDDGDLRRCERKDATMPKWQPIPQPPTEGEGHDTEARQDDTADVQQHNGPANVDPDDDIPF